MSEPSIDTLLSILQQRMDKCTTEQFWAVAALTAINAAVISHAPQLPTEIPRWLVAVLLSSATFYGEFFVIHRHNSYYGYRKNFAELLKDSSAAPKFMKDPKRPWELPQLTGLLFYSLWILGAYVLAMYVVLKC